MRDFVQPRVLKLAGIAALASTLACYPRLTFWLNRAYVIWYLVAAIFVCAIVLWGFVFAWHTKYTRRPVFVFRIEPGPFIAVTLLGITAAVVFHLFLDPSLRPKLPEEYPADLKQWMAWLLWSLAFNQLFLLFAPFAWSMRLFKNRWLAAGLTVLFGVFVQALRTQCAPAPISSALLTMFMACRIVTGSLAVWFYLRGGILLIWWWTFLFEARNLLDLTGGP